MLGLKLAVCACFVALFGIGMYQTIQVEELTAALDATNSDMAQCRALTSAANKTFDRCMAIIEPSFRQQMVMEQKLRHCMQFNRQ